MKPDYAKVYREMQAAIDKMAAVEGVPKPRKVAAIVPAK